MATTNPVFQVLIPTGNQAPIAAGSRVDALAIGQIGVFNFHTGLSLSAASVIGDTRDIFIAVGIDPLATGALADINKSAGQVIQARNAKSYTVKGYVDAVQKIVEVSGFKAKCETNYSIKVEFRNQKSYRMNGYNQFSKTFSYFTGCCADQCEPCGDGDCMELGVGIRDLINNDPDALITALLFANTITATVATEPTTDGTLSFTVGTETFTAAIVDVDTVTTAAAKIVAAINAVATSAYYASNVAGVITIYRKSSATASAATFAITGAVAGLTVDPIALANVTITDTAAFSAANPGVCPSLRITTVAEAINNYGAINLKYFNPRGTDIIVSLPDGFTCNGTVATVQELQYSEGKGYDVRQLEFVAGGWNGKPGPYRQSSISGLERDGITYFGVIASNYNMLSLTYDQMSVGGWLEYLNNLETIIAIPCADTVTLIALVGILDAIFPQFTPHTNDVAAMDCTNARTGLLVAGTDGIESLS